VQDVNAMILEDPRDLQEAQVVGLVHAPVRREQDRDPGLLQGHLEHPLLAQTQHIGIEAGAVERPGEGDDDALESAGPEVLGHEHHAQLGHIPFRYC
jgi:hypothetical protein